MKALYNIILLVIIYLVSNLLSSQLMVGQVIFTSIDDTTAIVNKPYYYKIEAYCIPDDETYELLEAPDNMTIESVTGEINWIPGSINDGGKVIVKATNSENESRTHEFFIYIAADIECPLNVVAYWNLDETLDGENDTTFFDNCGNNHAYVTMFKPIDTVGIVGLAQKFIPDKNPGIIVPDNAIFDWGTNDNFSIEFWFKMGTGDLDSTGVIIGRNQGSSPDDPHWWIGLDENNLLTFLIRTATGTAYTTISNFTHDFNWHHAVAVRDASAKEIALVVDGGLKESSAGYDGGEPGLITDAPLSIGWLDRGSSPYNEKFPFNGKLDELIIHNTALDINEIQTRFNNSKNGIPVCAPSNYAPLFITNPDTVVDEESSYSYQYLARDMDGDPLVYDVIKPAWLSHNPGTRTISGTPSDGDVGIFPVKIKVSDGTQDTVTQSFRIRVNNVNDKPILTDIETAAMVYHEDDGKVTITSTLAVTDTDDTKMDSARVWISDNYTSDEDMLAFTNTAEITGAWNASAGVMKLTGSASKEDYQAALRSVTYENADTSDPVILTRTVSFMISDGELNSVPVYRNINVSAVNDCPVISGHDSLTTPEEDTILIKTGHLVFSDIDDNPESLDITVASGINYTYSGNIVTPGKDFNGIISINVKLSDSECTVDYSLPVLVTPVNDPPSFIFPVLPKEAFENQTYLLTIRAIDKDPGDTVIYSIIQKPDWLNLIQDTILIGVPEFKDVGENHVIIRISDTLAVVDTSFIITVHSTNYIPHIISVPPVIANEDELYQYNISAIDTNSKDVIVLSAPLLPEWLTLNTSQQTLEGIPTNDVLGLNASVAFPVKLKVSDGKQDSTQTFTITVFNVNDAPEIKGQADTIIAFPDSSLVISLSDLIVEDVDNKISDLKLIVLSGTNYALNENSITIKTDQTGLLAVNVRVEDPGKLRDQAVLYIRIAIPSSIEAPAVADNPVIRVFPMPASDVIHFEILLPGEYHLELINITGKTVLQKEIATAGEIISIDLGNFPKGIYLYRIYNGKINHTDRFVVSK